MPRFLQRHEVGLARGQQRRIRPRRLLRALCHRLGRADLCYRVGKRDARLLDTLRIGVDRIDDGAGRFRRRARPRSPPG
jgi:hypothetical protein